MFKTQHAKAEDGSLSLLLSGSLDAAAAERLETELEALLISAGVSFLVLDMQKLYYLASAGLRVLLSSAKKGKKNGVELVVCGLQPLVSTVFKAAGFDRIFPVFPSHEEAHKSRRKDRPA